MTKKMVELAIQLKKLEIKRVELEIAQSQERQKALKHLEKNATGIADIGINLACILLGCVIVKGISSLGLQTLHTLHYRH